MEKKITIKASNKTPFINFDANSGLFQIHGYSLPENSLEFYEPIISWLDKYIVTPIKKTEFDIKLVALNTSSSKMFIDIFRRINHLVELNTSEVSVVWYYEIDDEDIHDIALQYQEICKAKFNLIGIHHRLIE
ncbi:MAG: DUF1987 domain-containing protein [Bacteroidales bacterium]|nr:DUF1987 domain-containing protein [Bacteroidales bacterium]